MRICYYRFGLIMACNYKLNGKIRTLKECSRAEILCRRWLVTSDVLCVTKCDVSAASVSARPIHAQHIIQCISWCMSFMHK